MGRVVKLVEQRSVSLEELTDEPRYGENQMAVGDGGADFIGDEGTLDEGAPLVATRTQAAQLAGEGEEKFVAAVGTMQPGEAGVQIATLEKRLDRSLGFRGE